MTEPEKVHPAAFEMRLSTGLFPFGYLLAATWALASSGFVALGGIMLYASARLLMMMTVWVLLAAVMGLACIVGGLYGFYKIAQAVVPQRVIVGSDGVAIRGIGRRQFVPYARLDKVTAVPGGVVLDTARLELELKTSSGWLPGDAARDRLMEAIERGRAARKPSAATDAELALLDRGGRLTDRWRVELLGLSRAGADYRRLKVDPESLASVVEDAAAPPARRIAAALAVSPAADAKLRDRIRVAAETSASLSLRAALRDALEGELDEAALTEAEAEQSEIRRS